MEKNTSFPKLKKKIITTEDEEKLKKLDQGPSFIICVIKCTIVLIYFTITIIFM